MIVRADVFSDRAALQDVKGDFFGDLIEVEVRGLGGVYNPDTPHRTGVRRTANIMTRHSQRDGASLCRPRRVLANNDVYSGARDSSLDGASVDVPDSLGVLAKRKTAPRRFIISAALLAGRWFDV